jgi:hypothetical protein
MSKGVIEFKTLLGYPKGGIASSFHFSSHEQYPSDNVAQNDLAHIVL